MTNAKTKSKKQKPKTAIKTPTSYYGGKQTLLGEILKLIPPHRIYTEVFFGGGAVFWAKTPADVAIINDRNSEIINFMECVKYNFDALQKRIQDTIYARHIFERSRVIYRNSKVFDKIERAWAFFVQCNMSYLSQLDSTWGFGINKSKNRFKHAGLKFLNKADSFNRVLQERMRFVELESTDAVRVLKSPARDQKEAFHYIDPPYFNSDCGHYAGQYTSKDLAELLDVLEGIKGRFLLSNYNSTVLDKYVRRNGWWKKEIVKPLSASKTEQGGTRKTKIEVLVANYDPDNDFELLPKPAGRGRRARATAA